jgi:hypothetical protein
MIHAVAWTWHAKSQVRLHVHYHHSSLLTLPSITSLWGFCEITIHNIVQNSQIVLLRLYPSSLNLSRIRFCLLCDPPRHKRDDRTSYYKCHRTCKALTVSWSVLGLEDLWPDRTTNLAIAVDKSDRKSTSSCTRSCLHSPWPHEREEGRSARVPDERGGVHGGIRRVDDQYSVTSYDDCEDTERIYWSGQSGVVGEEASNSNDDNGQDRYRQIEQLCLSDGGSYSECCPDESKEPEALVLERVDNFVQVEVRLGGARGVRG